MFAAEFEPAVRHARRQIGAPASLDTERGRGGLDRALCRVVDISLHGVRLLTYSALKRGTTIWLTLPLLGQVAADVVWADDYAAGCQFRRAIPEQACVALAAL